MFPCILLKHEKLKVNVAVPQLHFKKIKLSNNTTIIYIRHNCSGLYNIVKQQPLRERNIPIEHTFSGGSEFEWWRCHQVFFSFLSLFLINFEFFVLQVAEVICKKQSGFFLISSATCNTNWGYLPSTWEIPMLAKMR